MFNKNTRIASLIMLICMISAMFTFLLPVSADGATGEIGRDLMTTEEILPTILADPFADVTFSGGDPMFQAEGFTELAQAIKSQSHKNIWCYTGYIYECLLEMPAQRKLLQYIDVLVDGPFVESLKDETLRFRGSSNQRIIDVKKSLEAGHVVLSEYHGSVTFS